MKGSPMANEEAFKSIHAMEKAGELSPQRGYRVYRVGGQWGNKIDILENVTQSGGLAGMRVVGWTPSRPRHRDVLISRMNSGREHVFLFTRDITYCSDPSDMFFAVVAAWEYLDELSDDFIEKATPHPRGLVMKALVNKKGDE